MSPTSAGRPLQVVILGDWLPFPHGMATTSRVRLFARALLEAGVGVRVLSLQAVDRPPHIENTTVRGEYMGIPFEYACGTTVRRDSFAARRLIAARGWVLGAVRLVQLRRQGLLDLVLLWFWTPRPAWRLCCFMALLRLLRVPVVREVDESPWSQKPDANVLERFWSPLAGTAGAVTISAALHEWAAAEYRGRRGARIVDVPILVDVNEREPADYPRGEPLVVFAGSPVYKTTIRFIFAAMGEVWRLHPRCRLAITGAATSDPRADWLRDEARHAGLGDRVDLVGYLSRPELLNLYGRAHALLIPLFDDQQSRARFPTKIGEYLAAARPVVTNPVGEIPLHFTDGVDAVVCPPNDPVIFGRAIVDLLSDPARAALIGRRGRRVAETRFHYALYGETMGQAFAEITEVQA
ncbi:MAG: glycosyltransferase family 4 protein [Thermoleophilia bacterium]|nr:glycosyltransferase family 4 protein [Thermoleophilia bacterium]